MNVYLLDVGILLESDDKEFEYYSQVYDKKYGYYDENQYYLKDKQHAIMEAKAYVEAGIDKTYAVISRSVLERVSDLDDVHVEGEEYSLENVIYSIAKINGEIIENFLCG